MENSLKPLILHNPFDGHTHWRQKPSIKAIAPRIIKNFSGSEIMCNTKPNIIRLDNLRWYRDEVYEEIDANGGNFLPIFSMYLSPDMIVSEIETAWQEGLFGAVKYYPKGGTTGSDKGLTGFNDARKTLEVMQDLGIPLLVHGETPLYNGLVVNDFNREKLFMETEMIQLVKAFPRLNISLEHISTTAAVKFVLAHENVIATVTPQHCMFDSRALFNGVSMDERIFYYDLAKNGSHPSMVCRPILKFEEDKLAVQAALIQQRNDGSSNFGLGSDIAWHSKHTKHRECGACGMYPGPLTLELYAMAFEQMGILDHLQRFAGEIMPRFYGIEKKLPSKKIILSPVSQRVEEEYDDAIPPFAGQVIPWTAEVA